MMRRNGSVIIISISLFINIFIGGCINDTEQVSDAIDQDSSLILFQKSIAESIVDTTAVGLGALLMIQPVNNWSKYLQTYIQDIRFFNDSTGYLFIYDENCTCVAHAINSEIIGDNLKEYQDIEGNYVIQLLLEKASQGGGFVTYYWPKPDVPNEYEKIGYVTMIPGTSLFIGTGFYTGDSIEWGITSNITVDDSGSTLRLAVDDMVNLSLRDYGDGGYIWNITRVDSSLFQLRQHFNWGAKPGLVGDFGYDTWVFKAIGPGETTLTLVNHRPWMPIEDATMNFTITIQII